MNISMCTRAHRQGHLIVDFVCESVMAFVELAWRFFRRPCIFHRLVRRLTRARKREEGVKVNPSWIRETSVRLLGNSRTYGSSHKLVTSCAPTGVHHTRDSGRTKLHDVLYRGYRAATQRNNLHAEIGDICVKSSWCRGRMSSMRMSSSTSR